MDVKRCKKCGCIFSAGETRCPNCGIENSGRRMFEDTSCRFFSFKETEALKPKQRESVDQEAKRRRINVFLVVFALIVIPLKVIFGLAESCSGKK